MRLLDKINRVALFQAKQTVLGKNIAWALILEQVTRLQHICSRLKLVYTKELRNQRHPCNH